MEFSKRRLLINAITRGLEKALRVEEEPQDKYMEAIMLPPTPEEVLQGEADEAKRLKRIILEIRILLKVVPSQVRQRVLRFPGMNKLRELVDEAGYMNLPEDIRDTLRDCGIWD